MAVYEIEPAQNLNDSMFQNSNDIVASVSLHYKLPGKDTIVTLPYFIQNNFTFLNDADSSLRYATAVIMLGGLLKRSDLWKNYTWDDVIRIAKTAVNTNEYIQTEFLSLIEKAKKIYTPVKKRKKDTYE